MVGTGRCGGHDTGHGYGTMRGMVWPGLKASAGEVGQRAACKTAVLTPWRGTGMLIKIWLQVASAGRGESHGEDSALGRLP